MQIGLVIGRVIATRKDEKLVGTKLLITQPIQIDGTFTGNPVIAVDTVGAGVGERVIFVTGSVAVKAMPDGNAPVDAAIVGIVDSLES